MPGRFSLRSLLRRERRSHLPTITPLDSIHHNVDGLCQFCASLNLHAQDFKGSRNTTSVHRQASFQKVIFPPAHIIRRQGCFFCKFLLTAIINSNVKPLEWSEPCQDLVELSLEWVKDGRSLHDSVSASPSTRRLRVSANNDVLPDAYLILMASEASSKQFLGRTIDSSTIDIPTLGRWLTTCRDGHEGCREATGISAAEPLYSNPSFRMIDVKRSCIVSAKAEPFVALSYVWGKDPFYRALKDNIETLMQPGGLSSTSIDIPRTIKDAMHLTNLLGYRYLWVDSLCIVQDDSSDFARIVYNMDAVYNLATLTICAAGEDAKSGLHGVTNGSRKLRQAIIRYNEEVHLMVTRPAEFFVEQSRWNTRAWTFQERVFSRRCLIFVDERAFFQCRQSVMCEDIHMEDDISSNDSPMWSLEVKDAMDRIFLEHPIRQYLKFVQLYTQRELTYSTDRLAAFSAIAARLSKSLNNTFCAGLPASHFDFALLWTPSKQQPRASPARIPSFASWAWAGWTDGSEYSYSTLEGVLVNMHEWLTSRTWIDWYMVKPSESPSLVWDGTHSGPAGRWEGYTEPTDFSPYGRTQNCGHKDGKELDCFSDRSGRSDESTEPFKSGTEYDILQFCTHSAFFRVDPVRSSNSDLGEILHWYSIFDAEGNWCGKVMLDQLWANHGDTPEEQHLDEFNEIRKPRTSIVEDTEKIHEFIAISEARGFSTEEHDSWTCWDPVWELYYVLLIVTDKDSISERRGLGKIFKDAFRRSHQPGYSWKQLIMR
ncbi:heterokaryon incompatibility protein-domain-containing protein [Boeremia exigua]|uniref:heterokaryon incompatibility protein-domain-containing protein n=1 Tax=Boeremia exigua TaxID=749465 RepID=UPI001E8DFCD5|nr:heterokaryon incompatibility protein-domain-containing protein [Boeremia exigua]KAH6614061.1 heterokaryon incompatibility protein-domain-containing protein [Boeremia exigua]